MPKLGAIGAFIGAEAIKIEVGGKEYEFPGEVPGRTGVQVQRLFAAASDPGAPPDAEVLTDLDYEKIRAEILGDGQQAMLDDGVGSAAIQLVWEALFAYHGIGEAAAQAVLARGEAPAPAKKRSARTTSTAGATRTRSQGSTSGTSTRQAKSPAPRKSPGRRS